MPDSNGRTPWPWIRRVLAAVLAGLACAVGAAVPAHAHASLVGTDPAEGAVLATAPARVLLRFDEPVRLADRGVQVFDAAGSPLAAEAGAADSVVGVTLPGGLSGTYVVAWRVISADGHPVAGALTFSVGAPSPRRVQPAATDAGTWAVPPLAVAQTTTYLGLFLAVGLAVFSAFLLPAGASADRLRDRLVPVTRAGAVTAAVAAGGTIGLTVADQQGLGPDALVSGVAWAGATLDQLIGLGLLLTGLLAVGAAPALRSPAARAGAVAAGAALAVGAPAITGHSRAFGPSWLVIATDVLHVLAGSIWLGGLVGLVIVLAATRTRPKLGVVALTRFSTAAAGVLAALLLTGTILSWRILASWDSLVGTSYGRLLLAKIALVAVAAGVAGWNRFVLLPTVRGRPDPEGPGKRRGRQEWETARGRNLTGIGRLAVVEASLLVAVLGITGVLVDQSPRPEATVASTAAVTTATAPLGGAMTARATLDPGAVGQNRILIELRDAAGRGIEPGEVPTVRIRSDALDLGPVPVTRQGGGRYQGTVLLPAAGRWRVQVGVRLSEFDNPVTELTLQIG
ncbi:MAG: copper resistance protein CopC [Micropruina sp.]|uniref:copper resistance CopC/CopD family protein n=1 Tax=Micropruina sp. TaxID=2737536 RepID=UPI0039E57E6B